MRFRPCIDLHHGKVKQIVGSSLKDADTASLCTNFESELPASHFASLYRRDNLSGGHIIMLGAGNESAARDALAAFPNGMHIGGGLTPANARFFLDAGASHVIISSYIFVNSKLNLDRLQELNKIIGKSHIVLDLSCKNYDDHYHIMIDRWQTTTDVSLSAEIFSLLSAFCDEFLVHATDIEGKQSGIAQELVELLGRECPIRVTYAGGIRSLNDLKLVKKSGADRVDATIGSALDIFGGPLSYRSVVQWHQHNCVA